MDDKRKAGIAAKIFNELCQEGATSADTSAILSIVLSLVKLTPLSAQNQIDAETAFNRMLEV